MTDQVLVFTRAGIPLDELPVSITRAWKVSRVIEAARGSFTISTTNPKATAANLKYGNIVFVQSSSGVQPWAGIIWPPMSVANGVITVQLKSVEYILSTRLTPEHAGGRGATAATNFMFLLDFFGRNGNEYPIDADNAVLKPTSSAGLDIDWHFANLYEEANKLANSTLNYWWLEPIYTDGRLTLIPYFVSKTGRNFAVKLIENNNFNDVKITEKGDKFANVIVGWCDTKADGEIYAIAENPTSIGRYGEIQAAVALNDIDTLEGVEAAVTGMLPERAFPLLELSGVVTARPFPRAGDTVSVQLSTAGAFLVQGRGMTIDGLVVSAAYSPETDEMLITVRELPEEGMDDNAT